ncbi:MAG: hypothetical protein OXO49_09425 [Gammaproteobacteria bacterium]|nr:hypothetical protein [Gammaproteobacteria bacterium]MDE0252802.1 hypothetical protein [Gammaproteobacteria bacterium]MDE0402188.1 hypothetical protein [Gammaproteobacteria bacterium]
MNKKLEENVEIAINALSECKSDFEKLIAREQTTAYQLAGSLHSKVIQSQVMASHVLMDAERLIVKMNPKKRRWWGKQVETTVPQVVSSSELRKMRRVHSRISDRGYQKLKARSLEKLEPLSREKILQAIQRNAALSGAGAAGATSVIISSS